jgi:hypothetical protein
MEHYRIRWIVGAIAATAVVALLVVPVILGGHGLHH